MSHNWRTGSFLVVFIAVTACGYEFPLQFVPNIFGLDPNLLQEEVEATVGRDNFEPGISTIEETPFGAAFGGVHRENITTKNNTFVKDGVKTTDIRRNGPGYQFRFLKVESAGNKTGNRSKSDFSSSLMRAGKLFGSLNPLKSLLAPEAKLKAGSTCYKDTKCPAGLKCVWGKCNKAKHGSPGTFCSRNSQCNSGTCCVDREISDQKVCIIPQLEGAVCGTMESIVQLIFEEKDECKRCKAGLKCAAVGDDQFKYCVKESYVEQTEDEKEAEDSEDDDNNGDNEGSSDGQDKGIPIKQSPDSSGEDIITKHSKKNAKKNRKRKNGKKQTHKLM